QEAEDRRKFESAVTRRGRDRGPLPDPGRGSGSSEELGELFRLHTLRRDARDERGELLEVREQALQRVVPPGVERIGEAKRRPLAQLLGRALEDALEVVEL